MDKEIEQKQKITDYRDTFSTPHGKRVLDDLRRESGFDRYSRPRKGLDGHTDIHAEIFDRGSQYIVARIIVFMNKEYKERKEIQNA